MDAEYVLEKIRHMRILGLRPTGGSSVSFRLFLEGDVDAAFKPQTVDGAPWRTEVAAWVLSRLLGLCSVPPADSRIVNVNRLVEKLKEKHPSSARDLTDKASVRGKNLLRGAVAYWVPDLEPTEMETAAGAAEWIAQLSQSSDVKPGHEEDVRQLSQLLLFDYLIANWDRFSGGNIFRTPGGRIIFLDNNAAFSASVNAQRMKKLDGLLKKVEKFSAGFVDRLRSLDMETMTASFRKKTSGTHLLSMEEVGAVMKRRGVILDHVEELIRKHGRERVMLWP